MQKRDQCPKLPQFSGRALGRGEEGGAKGHELRLHTPKQGEIASLGGKASKLHGETEGSMIAGEVREHGGGGAVGGHAEHDFRRREAIACKEILGHGGPEGRVLERRAGHGQHQPGPRALVGRLKLPHVQGGDRCG